MGDFCKKCPQIYGNFAEFASKIRLFYICNVLFCK